MRSHFDHEKLKVNQAAIGFVTWSTDLLILVEAKAAVKDQLDRASTSVALNIAWLDVLVAKRLLEENAVRVGKEHLLEIVSMLVGLISSLSARIQEDASNYFGSE